MAPSALPVPQEARGSSSGLHHHQNILLHVSQSWPICRLSYPLTPTGTEPRWVLFSIEFSNCSEQCGAYKKGLIYHSLVLGCGKFLQGWLIN